MPNITENGVRVHYYEERGSGKAPQHLPIGAQTEKINIITGLLYEGRPEKYTPFFNSAYWYKVD